MEDLRSIGVWCSLLGILLITVPIGAGIGGAALQDDRPTSLAPGETTGRTDADTVVSAQSGESYRTAPDGAFAWHRQVDGRLFAVQRVNDSTVLEAFTVADATECGRFAPPCGRTGVRLVDPASNETRFEWSYPVRDVHNSEIHDAEYLPERGEILVAGMEYERVFALDVATGTVVWQWNASEQYAAPDDPTTTDWLHINDVDRIGPGRYLVSVRNTNQLLVLDREEGVVEVVNADGNESVMDEQHNPQWLGNGTVLVADSRNNRVVELERNRTSGRWDVGWTVSSVGDVPLNWPRDADRLPNGNTLITDVWNRRVVEVDERGEAVWTTGTPHMVYEADRVPHGELPAVAVEPHGPPAGPSAVERLLTPPTINLYKVGPVYDLYAGAHTVYPLPSWVEPLHLLGVVTGTAASLVGSVVFILSRF